MRDYTLTTHSPLGITPNVSLRVVEEVFRKDSTVRAAVRATTSAILRRGYSLKNKKRKSKSELEKATKFLEDNRFKKLLRKIIHNLKVYDHCFIEIRKNNSGTAKELYVLETVEMEIETDKHGDITKFVQRPEGTAETVDFPVEDVVYIAMEELTSNVFGEVGFESLFLLVSLKQYILKYINYLFATNKFRDFFAIKNAGEEQVKEFVTYLKACEDDITKPLLVRGEVEHKVLRQLTEATDLISLLNACDNRILMLMQVPPIIAGIPDNSNRGSSETQERNFYIHIEDLEEICKESFTYDLLPKCGFENVEFDFPTANQTELAKDLEMAERMKNMGVKDEMIDAYLRSVGLDVPEGKMFKTPEEKMKEMQMMNPMEEEGENKKSDDMRPSRHRKPKDEKSKNQPEPTSRPDQFVGNSKAFGEYPYVMNNE